MDYRLTIEPAQLKLTGHKPDLMHTARRELIERSWGWIAVFVVLNAAVIAFGGIDPLSAGVAIVVAVAGYFIGRRMEWKSVTIIERHS
jgi:hypothetical protein